MPDLLATLRRWVDPQLARLVLRFAAWFAVLYAAVLLVAGHTPYVAGLEAATARAAASLIAASGVHASLTGYAIAVPGRVLEISLECTGIYVAVTLVALLLAYPVRLSLRLLGAVAGVLVVALANLVRLVLVAELAVAAPSLFPFVHDFLFQIGMMLVAVTFWVVWLSEVRRRALA